MSILKKEHAVENGSFYMHNYPEAGGGGYQLSIRDTGLMHAMHRRIDNYLAQEAPKDLTVMAWLVDHSHIWRRVAGDGLRSFRIDLSEAEADTYADVMGVSTDQRVFTLGAAMVSKRFTDEMFKRMMD
jgi:hypothetical protein